jgi:hypothetical protein
VPLDWPAAPDASAHESHPRRALDSFVFVITCAFLAPPFFLWAVLSIRAAREDSVFTTFAPFVAAVVLLVLLLLLEFVERLASRGAPGWPPVLVGLPVVCALAGLSYTAVDPTHHWWRDGLAGVAWGAVTAAWGLKRWRAQAEGAPTPAAP